MRLASPDASCLISMSNMDRLDLLKHIFNTVTITPEIGHEFGDKLPDWIIVETVSDRQKQLLLELEVDKGEASG